MAKRERLEFEASFVDRASKPVDDLADKVERLDGRTAEVEVTADDNASDDLERVSDNVVALDGADAEIELSVDDNATEEIERVEDDLEEMDRRTVDATMEADDKATGDIRRVDSRLDELDRRTVDATMEADDKATGDIRRIDSRLDDLDRRTVDATLEADDKATGDIGKVDSDLDELDRRTVDATLEADDKATGDISRIDSDLDELDRRSVDATVDIDGNAKGDVDSIASKLAAIAGGVGGAKGLAASAGAALAAMTGLDAQVILDVQQVADYTGTSVNNASRLLEVLKQKGTGIEKGDLMDVIGQMSSQLAANPGLIEELGLSMDVLRMGPFDQFVTVVDALNTSQMSANDKMLLGQQLFGEEGVRQINSLITRLGPDGLSGAMSDIEAGNVIGEDDVAAAIALAEETAELEANLSAASMELKRGLIPLLTDALGLINAAFPDEGKTWFGGILEDDSLERRLETIDENVIKHATFWQTVMRGLGDDVLEGLNFDETLGSLAEMSNGVVDLDKASANYTTVQERLNEVLADGEITYNELLYVTADTTEATEEQEEAVRDAVAAIEDQVTELENQRDALKDSTDALEDQIDAQQSLADIYLDITSKGRRAQEASANYNKVLAEGAREGESNVEFQRRLADALDEVVSSANDVAEAEVDKARAEREARGASLGHREAIDIQNRSLIRQAQTLSGPERRALLDHIGRLNGIPDSVTSEILALIEQGKIAEAEALLNSTSRTRTAAIGVDVNDWALQYANTQLALLTAPRSTLITPHIAAPTGHVKYAMASGSPSTPAGAALLVGEQGPELVKLPAGSEVVPAGQTAEQLRKGGSPQNVHNYYTTINVPRGTDARGVLKGERRYTRIQGPT